MAAQKRRSEYVHRFHFELPLPVYASLQRAAAEETVSVAALVRLIVRAYLRGRESEPLL